MKAKLLAITACTPAPKSALTASSRELPLPKPLSATLIYISFQFLGQWMRVGLHDCVPSCCPLPKLWPKVLETMTAQISIVDTGHEFGWNYGVTS